MQQILTLGIIPSYHDALSIMAGCWGNEGLSATATAF